MRSRFERPFRDPMWIMGVASAALTASGAFAIVLAIPPSIASVGQAGGATVGPVSIAPVAAEGTQGREALTTAAVAPTSTDRPRRMSCSECGVVASVRRVDRQVQADGNDNAGGATGPAVDAGAGASEGPGATESGTSYEVTVRFRDGSTATFVELRLPNVRPGGRVIVIGGADASGP